MVKKKNKRLLARVFSLIGVLLVLCCMVVPAAAVTNLDDGTEYFPLVNVAHFDTAVIAESYVTPFPYSVIDEDGSSGSVDYDFFDYEIDSEVYVRWDSDKPSSEEYFYTSYQTVVCPGGNWQSLSLSNSEPFVLSPNNWMLLVDNFSVLVPKNTEFTFVLSLVGFYPVESPSGGFNWTRVSGSYSVTVPPSSSSSWIDPVPFMSDVLEDFVTGALTFPSFYCTSIEFFIDLYTPLNGEPIGYISYKMPYIDRVNVVSLLDYFVQYPRENTYIVEVADDSLSGIGSFLASSATGFFRAEIIPGLPLGGILAAVVGVLVFIGFVKILR